MSHTVRPLPSAPWYREAFQEGYLDLYGHRDLAEAARAVRFLSAALGLRREHRVLDLCCGPGRHLFFLGRLVDQAVGLDLSRVLLAGARDHWSAGVLATEGGAAGDGGNSDWEPGLPEDLRRPPLSPRARLVLGTMSRLPFADGSFDRVLNLFTSFGYYEEESKNLQVLAGIARVLRPGQRGMLAMDHINAEALLAGFRRRSERTLPGGEHVIEERQWLEAQRRVVKWVTCRLADGQIRSWHESVRVYEPDELETMFFEAGLEPRRRFGDYDGQPWTPASPRLILLAARRSADRVGGPG